MNFNDACDKAFDLENERLEKAGKGRFGIDPKTMRMFCFIWNFLAIAKNSDDTMEDLVYLDERNEVVSIPLRKKKKTSRNNSKPKKKAPKTTTGQKKSVSKTADKDVLDGESSS